jgi:amino-acid N-acetyltransferase
MSEIRRARPEDIPHIAELITSEGLPPYGLDEYLDTFFVLDDGATLVGCAGLELYGQAALVRSVVVLPHLRGKRDGRRLVERTLAEARERGVRRVYLFTMSAGPFFERLGFRELAPEAFEEAVRPSRQYQAITSMPQLRARLIGMTLELSAVENWPLAP